MKHSSATRAARRDELDQALQLVYFGFRALVRSPDDRLATRGFGRAQHRLLYYIARRPGHSLHDVGDGLQITRQALHEGIRPLVRARLVALTPDGADRRRHLVHLTPRGRALEETLSGLQRTMMARVFRRAGPAAECGWRRVMELLAGELATGHR